MILYNSLDIGQDMDSLDLKKTSSYDGFVTWGKQLI